MSTDNEQELIARIMSGEGELFGELIDRYKTGLYYHCFAILRDEDAAEDVAQEAFIQAYRQLRRYDSKHRFSTWLYKIATHKAIDALRKNRTVPLDADFAETLPSTLPPTDRRVVYRELHDAVAELSPQYRSVVSLHYWQGKSYEEIAAIMNAPAGTVKGWLHRAKQQLKEALS
jgi:RNA polymerase sigma-70 factor, ECF subfamily